MADEERNIFQKIGDAVVDYAPSVAGILALVPGVGVIPAAALGAVASLGKACGLGTNAKPEEVLAAVTADPEIRLKAQIAENDFKVKMRDAEIAEMNINLDKLRAQLSDIQNARLMNTEAIKATGKRDFNLYALAWLNTLGFYVMIGFFIWMLFAQVTVSVPQALNDILFMLVGCLVTNYTGVNTYFFGSSAGSDLKTQLMNLRK
jgi:hypothetical protein